MVKAIQSPNLLEDVQRLKNLLVAWATGDQTDDGSFASLRLAVLGDSRLARVTPRFLKSCRTRHEFWAFIQPQFSRYQERRAFLAREFGPLLDLIEADALRADNSDCLSASFDRAAVNPLDIGAATVTQSGLTLFISHSSKDTPIAEALADLMRDAFALRAAQIRCTSVNGYRLQGGAMTDQTLRREVCEAQTFIGLITGSSIESAYVLFELGARWGIGKHFVPLLAAGGTASLLRGPMAAMNALSCDDAAQIHQLIDELGPVIGQQSCGPASYHRRIEALMQVSKSRALPDVVPLGSNDTTRIAPTFTPTDVDLEILKYLSDQRDESAGTEELVKATKRKRTLIEYRLNELERNDFVVRHESHIGEDQLNSLEDSGRKYLIDNDYL